MKKGISKWTLNLDLEDVSTKALTMNVQELSKYYNIPHRRMSDLLIKHKISVLKKTYILKKNDDFFNEIDSEIKAYLLGYLVADGCVSIEAKKRNGVVYSYNRRVCFSVSVDDEETILLYKKFVSPNCSLRYFHNTNGAVNRKRQISFKISSKEILETLMNKHNVHPRKTYDILYTIPDNSIDKQYLRDFIRGYLDGDGCISAKGVVSFVATSKPFLEQIKSIFEKEIPNSKIRISEQHNKNMITYQLYVNKVNEEVYNNFFQYIYKDATYFLERKFLKIPAKFRAKLMTKKHQSV